MSYNEVTSIPTNLPYEIELISVAEKAHVIRDGVDWPVGDPKSCEVLIVGAGVAGLTAANLLRERDYLVCEVSDFLGGSSGAGEHEGMPFCRGAHYELEFSQQYGDEGLEFLEGLGVIRYEKQRKVWGFVDTRHLIGSRRYQRVYRDGSFSGDLLPEDNPGYADFTRILDEYRGKLPTPTWLTGESERELNELTFYRFLQDNGVRVDREFEIALSYQMRDDYGAGMRQVSALAGLHYYLCRPYFWDEVKTFSPPEGNYYFIRKLADRLSPERILTGQMVYKIEPDRERLRVLVADIANQRLIPYDAESVVFAGHKHSLKQIYPRDFPVYEQNRYAPWVVFNMILNNPPQMFRTFWQNEALDLVEGFAGIVNSGVQAFDRRSTQRILTGYLCLSESQREDVLDFPRRLEHWTELMLDVADEILRAKVKDSCEKVVVTPLGHAMPIPAPGYLLKDGNQHRSHPRLVYAGSDNNRLPIFFEALDSAIQAVKLL